jgi:hypothetical protein
MAKTKVKTQTAHQVFYKDPFLLVLLAVVFSAAAIILLRTGGLNSLNPLASGVVKQVQSPDSPDGMMQSLEDLNLQVDTGELDQLGTQAKGL